MRDIFSRRPGERRDTALKAQQSWVPAFAGTTVSSKPVVGSMSLWNLYRVGERYFSVVIPAKAGIQLRGAPKAVFRRDRSVTVEGRWNDGIDGVRLFRFHEVDASEYECPHKLPYEHEGRERTAQHARSASR
jgi:hypothetical protein